MASKQAEITPSDPNAERCALGCVLIDPSCLPAVEAETKAAHFHDRRHGRIMGALSEMDSRGEPMDLNSLAAKLEASGDLDYVGGRSYLIELTCAVPTAVNAAAYAKMVALNFRRRDAMRAARELLGRLAESEDPVNAFRTASLKPNGGGASKKADTMAGWLKSTGYEEELVKQESRPVMTGCLNLDKLMGGLHRGEISFLAARPSVGKTSAAMAMSRFMDGNGFRIAFVSAEMPVQSILDRYVTMESGLRVRDVRSGMVNMVPGSPQSVRIMEGIGKLAERRTVLVRGQGMSVKDVRASLMPYAVDGGLDVVFVDYIQLLKGDDVRSRNDQLDSISRDMLAMADDLNCHVMCLSQLSREGTGEPSLHHLRDSGCLEQAANQVVMLWRESMVEPIRVKVAKNRDGMTGSCSMDIDFATYSFR